MTRLAAQLRKNASTSGEPLGTEMPKKNGAKSVFSRDKGLLEWLGAKRRENLKGVMRPVGGK